ncbi:MAG: flagellar basal-body rod protein FlgF [Alphaproteobacteria bacterium]|nr:MAG: flagellar basal-body rod protein FlgF [Alphaproteobacteria bacterium]
MNVMLAVGLAHQQAMRQRMDVVASNIANSSTVGFKAERARFRDEVYEMPGSQPGQLRRIHFVVVDGLFRDMAEGPIEVTGNPLDLAIKGKGFFTVEGRDGNTYYTRFGSFQLNGDRELILPSGEKVLDAGDQPIVLAPEDTDIRIDEAGVLHGAQGPIAQLRIVQFDDEKKLERRGNTLLASSDEPKDAEQDFRIVQGALEASNVKPIVEMTKMIQVLRAYQAMQRSVETGNRVEERAIERLPSVQA